MLQAEMTSMETADGKFNKNTITIRINQILFDRKRGNYQSKRRKPKDFKKRSIKYSTTTFQTAKAPLFYFRAYVQWSDTLM